MFKISDLSARLLSSRMRAAAARPIDVGAISDTIQRALSAAGLMRGSQAQDHAPRGMDQRRTRPSPDAVDARVIPFPSPARSRGVESDEIEGTGSTTAADAVDAGHFLSRSFSNEAGTREYKIYVPAVYAQTQEPVPMIVMLHGCMQSPDDFAAGTRMNDFAEEHCFIVVYPAQAGSANGSKCWNWFRSEDQSRDRGEPVLIAGLVRDVASTYRIDDRRIFVAGLSAGAAMAVILGATHPELFAAVGAHSGLPYRAAHDMPSAFGAMQGARPFATAPSARASDATQLPTIVFHGDSDFTVNCQNGTAIAEQASNSRKDQQPLRVTVHDGVTSGGRTYRRTVYADSADQPFIEEWVLHGAGHAWSGGSARGTYTDASGPDASAEMIRFFYAQRRAGSA